MAVRESAPLGAPIWVDLMSTDVERSRAFYASLFGWTSEEPNPDFGGYFNFSKDGVLVAGGMPAMRPDATDVWSVYLATDDAAKTAELVLAHGGQVHAPPMAVMELGTMAVFGDPAGAAIGVWQPGTHKGFGLIAEAGAPGWFELHTRDYGTALDFYKNVFHWDTEVVSDAPEFRYTTMNIGTEQYAGVMDAAGFLPEGIPSHWSVYFAVDDTDKMVEKVIELGGAVADAPQDTPYGRLATVSDPNGAVFKLVGTNHAMPAAG